MIEDFIKAAQEACSNAGVILLWVGQDSPPFIKHDPHNYTLVWIGKDDRIKMHTWNTRGYSPEQLYSWISNIVNTSEYA